MASKLLTPLENNDDERRVMETLLNTYGALVQQIQAPPATGQRTSNALNPVNILFTGSTGTIGPYILRALLDRDNVGHVFCLNRAEDGGSSAQMKSFVAARLSTTGLDDRTTFIKAALHQPRLGLDESTYKLLQSQVGLIIHAAWPVNFKLPLSGFRPQLVAIVNLLAFASTASSKFVFISSIAAVAGKMAEVPLEEVVTNLDYSAPLGYGRAKLIAELLIDTAVRCFGSRLPATIVRVGQVAGAVGRPGLWNPEEWFPSMVLSSLHLRYIPDNLGRFNSVDFVPVDMLGEITVDLAMATTAHGTDTTARVFNLRNPYPTPWHELLPAIVNAAATTSILPLQVVAPRIWLAKLRESADVGDDDVTAAKNPGVKLVDYFGLLWSPSGQVVESTQAPSHPMAIERALAASSSLRELQPVGLQWVEKWTKEWMCSTEVSHALKPRL
ncbi:male sterility protein-domain-containing protein [Xylaria arbuscula]|nr:male sterility protein-domain-containing protein [Xylaria arbuscula]